MKIAVCVCTYRRPDGLSKLLEHLAAINWTDELIVVVADNDNIAQQGITVVNALRQSYRWPIEAHPVSERGFSYSRNTAAAKALQHDPDFVAYIDDDEWPTVNWLKELVRVQQQHDADAVGGPTESVFPEHATPTQRSNPYYGARLELPDSSPCQLEASGNCLIRAATLRSYGPVFFLPQFALSGGEDLAFFEQLKQSGHTMYWSAAAKVYESVSDDRLSDQWMKQRVILNANTRVRIMRIFYPGFIARSVRLIKTAGLFTVAGLLTFAGLVNRQVADKARILRWKFWGKFTAHININPSH